MATVSPVVDLGEIRVVRWRWAPEPNATKPWWAPEVYVVENCVDGKWKGLAMVTSHRTIVSDVDRAMGAMMRVILIMAGRQQPA